MMRRSLELACSISPAELDWQLRPLLDLASDIRMTAADLRWHAWERYSNRQGTKISMDGFVGTDLAPFGSLLRTAEVLHIGKGATLGMGRVEIAP